MDVLDDVDCDLFQAQRKIYRNSAGGKKDCRNVFATDRDKLLYSYNFKMLSTFYFNNYYTKMYQ